MCQGYIAGNGSKAEQTILLANPSNGTASTIILITYMLQMHVYAYCDFIVWQTSDIHIERLSPKSILTDIKKAENFFTLCVTPELRGKWFTRAHSSLASTQANSIDGEDAGN